MWWVTSAIKRIADHEIDIQHATAVSPDGDWTSTLRLGILAAQLGLTERNIAMFARLGLLNDVETSTLDKAVENPFRRKDDNHG